MINTQPEMVKLLLDNGADVSLRCGTGNVQSISDFCRTFQKFDDNAKAIKSMVSFATDQLHQHNASSLFDSGFDEPDMLEGAKSVLIASDAHHVRFTDV